MVWRDDAFWHQYICLNRQVKSYGYRVTANDRCDCSEVGEHRRYHAGVVG